MNTIPLFSTPHFEAIYAKMPHRSYWQRGVRDYALGFMQQMEEEHIDHPKMKDLLNGARDWHDWAWDGCGLVYDAEIAKRLCSPSELKKTRGGELRPNRQESWLDVEARAAFQAAHYIVTAKAF